MFSMAVEKRLKDVLKYPPRKICGLVYSCLVYEYFQRWYHKKYSFGTSLKTKNFSRSTDGFGKMGALRAPILPIHLLTLKNSLFRYIPKKYYFVKFVELFFTTRETWWKNQQFSGVRWNFLAHTSSSVLYFKEWQLNWKDTWNEKWSLKITTSNRK